MSDKRIPRPETGWAITGPHGLYTGWWLTRKDAIDAHVRDKVLFNYRGDDPVRDVWKLCQKEGDRAVKVRVTVVAEQPSTPEKQT